MKIQKRVTAFITALTMIVPAAEIAGYRVSAAETQNEIIYGDLNSDKNVDVTDLSVLSLYLIGDRELENDMQKEAADVQYDGVIDLGDLACMRQYLSKKTESIGKPSEDITDKCTVLKIADYYGQYKIYEGFEYNWTKTDPDGYSMESEIYDSVLITSMDEFNKYIAYDEYGTKVFEDNKIEINEEFFKNNYIAMEVNSWECNGIATELTSVKRDSQGNIDLYFERRRPAFWIELLSFYRNIVIIPVTSDDYNKLRVHYNSYCAIYESRLEGQAYQPYPIIDVHRITGCSYTETEKKPETYGIISSNDELGSISECGLDMDNVISEFGLSDKFFTEYDLAYCIVPENSVNNLERILQNQSGEISFEFSNSDALVDPFVTGKTSVKFIGAAIPKEKAGAGIPNNNLKIDKFKGWTP